MQCQELHTCSLPAAQSPVARNALVSDQVIELDNLIRLPLQTVNGWYPISQTSVNLDVIALKRYSGGSDYTATTSRRGRRCRNKSS